jgi:hypothetical protein
MKNRGILVEEIVKINSFKSANELYCVTYLVFFVFKLYSIFSGFSNTRLLIYKTGFAFPSYFFVICHRSMISLLDLPGFLFMGIDLIEVNYPSAGIGRRRDVLLRETE